MNSQTSESYDNSGCNFEENFESTDDIGCNMVILIEFEVIIQITANDKFYVSNTFPFLNICGQDCDE